MKARTVWKRWESNGSPTKFWSATYNGEESAVFGPDEDVRWVNVWSKALHKDLLDLSLKAKIIGDA